MASKADTVVLTHANGTNVRVSKDAAQTLMRMGFTAKAPAKATTKSGK